MNIFKITGLAAAGIMLAACQSDSYKINGECDLLSNGDTIFITYDFSSGKPFAHSVVNEVVTDETGNLNPEYTYDEVHLLGKYYSVWTDFLLQHGIVKE